MANPNLTADELQRLKKPKKGTARIERITRSRAREAAEDKNKAEAKKRDGQKCRRPSCPHCREYGRRLVPQAAHVFAGAKGMGGDPKLIRSQVKHLVTLDPISHGEQERGELRLEAMDSTRLADGPIAFFSGDVFEGVSLPAIQFYSDRRKS